MPISRHRKGRRKAMKIPSRRIDLAEIGYEGLWIEAPKSVKEGWFNDLAKLTRSTDGKTADPEKSREANAKVLDLITAWNLTDDLGNELPILSELHTYEEKTAIMGELPMDVILHIVKSVLGADVPEKTKDF